MNITDIRRAPDVRAARLAARKAQLSRIRRRVRAFLKREIVIELAPAPVWAVLIAAAIFFGAVGWIYNKGVEQGQLSALHSAYDIVRKNARAD